jgi:hypothetical protein
MRAPDRYSVSPLPSFCTVVPVHRTPSFAETVKAVWRWVTGHHALPLREQIRDARLVEALADEIVEEETNGTADRDVRGPNGPASDRKAAENGKVGGPNGPLSAADGRRDAERISGSRFRPTAP